MLNNQSLSNKTKFFDLLMGFLELTYANSIAEQKNYRLCRIGCIKTKKHRFEDFIFFLSTWMLKKYTKKFWFHLSNADLSVKLKIGYSRRIIIPNIEIGSGKREMTSRHSTGLHNHPIRIPLKMCDHSSRENFVENRYQLQSKIRRI